MSAVLIVICLLLPIQALAADTSKPVYEDNVDHLHEYWNYRDPEESERRFRALIEVAQQSDNPDYFPVLLSQIARTYSLRGQFVNAMAQLHEAQKLVQDRNSVAWAYLLIEYGRVYNSAGDKEEARKYFEDAFRVADLAGDDYLATDAAHMMAIAEALPNQMKWNVIALGIAESSSHPRARDWRGSLYNNIGWTHFDKGEYDQAMEMFRKGVAFRAEKGQGRRLQIARWAVARTHRALGNHELALGEQLKLEQEQREAGAPADGYVIEEIAELYHLKDDPRAATYFEQAYNLLYEDAWLRENEPDRLDRLRRLSQAGR